MTASRQDRAQDEQKRCRTCGWPFDKPAAEGCVVGGAGCCYRPSEGSEEWARIEQRRALIRAKEEDHG